MNHYAKWCFFKGMVVTCNEDDTIPLNAIVVIDLRFNSKGEEEGKHVVEIHNSMRNKLLQHKEVLA